jgi:hypothetical protein
MHSLSSQQMARKLAIILLVSVLMLSASHPFYLSVTSLKYASEERSLQGSVKVFTSDLESALTRLSGKKSDLLHPVDSTALLQQLQSYLGSRLKIRADQKTLSLKLIGFENQEEATWLYIELSLETRPARLSVENTILYDYLPGQMNIVQVEWAGKEQSGRLNNPDRYLEFNF